MASFTDRIAFWSLNDRLHLELTFYEEHVIKPPTVNTLSKLVCANVTL